MDKQTALRLAADVVGITDQHRAFWGPGWSEIIDEMHVGVACRGAAEADGDAATQEAAARAALEAMYAPVPLEGLPPDVAEAIRRLAANPHQL